MSSFRIETFRAIGIYRFSKQSKKRNCYKLFDKVNKIVAITILENMLELGCKETIESL
jgi:hypothetical protein